MAEPAHDRVREAGREAAGPWFLSLCGPLVHDGDGHQTATARFLPRPDAPVESQSALALEALHQISCRLAAAVRGARRCVPVRLDEFRGTASSTEPEHLLRARVLRSGPLSTVEATVTVGHTTYRATVCTREIQAGRA